MSTQLLAVGQKARLTKRFGPAEVVWIRDGWTRRESLDPAGLGFARHKLSDVAVASRDEAVAVLLELINGEGPQAMQDMLALNLGVALHLLEDDLTVRQGVDKAREAVASRLAADFWADTIQA